MSKKEQQNPNEEQEQQAQDAQVNETQEQPQGQESQEPQEPETAEQAVDRLLTEVENQKKEYMFLMAEFDNYRKRTIREKADLIKSAAGRAMEDLLPVVDDFERAIEANKTTDDIDTLKQGFELIYSKFVAYLEKQQVRAMESTGVAFDSDVHEAVTTFPAPTEEQKGMVIDTVLKGYTINDKVLRHAKVVVGQ